MAAEVPQHQLQPKGVRGHVHFVQPASRFDFFSLGGGGTPKWHGCALFPPDMKILPQKALTRGFVPALRLNTFTRSELQKKCLLSCPIQPVVLPQFKGGNHGCVLEE